jgi:hypothetical protein
VAARESAGVQDLVLMRIAGHPQLQMTSGYIRISDDAKRDAVHKLEQWKRRARHACCA